MTGAEARSAVSVLDALQRRLERLDWFTLGAVALLVAVGMVFIASAAPGAEGGSGGAGLLARQVVFLALGGVVFALLQKADYIVLLRNSPAIYALGLLALAGLFATRPVNGARSWYDLLYFKIQPAEFFKPVLILTLSHYLMYRDSYKRLSGLIVPLLIALAPMALIMKQPDLGTMLVLVPVVAAILFAAGARLPHLALIGLAGASSMVLFWFTILHDYQKRRVLAWLNPEQYRLGEAWQLLHSEMAIGSGGLWGKGWGESSQAGLSLLPEKHTDFIFAVVAEEGGFLVAGIVLVLLALVALAGYYTALRTREPAGRLIAVGIGTLFGFQALTNAGVALGLLPTTGLTLPFVSYGGSSLVASCACLGLLLNISSRQEPVLAREAFA